LGIRVLMIVRFICEVVFGVGGRRVDATAFRSEVVVVVIAVIDRHGKAGR